MRDNETAKVLGLLGPAARDWFRANFSAPTRAQAEGWRSIAANRHTLVTAPTGSGKTLAAFLWSLDRLALEPAGGDRGVRVVYVSPLKALVYDVERNLRAPLAGLQRSAERLGIPARTIEIAVRTGDTPQRERQRQAREPADILVTTPESLYLILGSAGRAALSSVETIIVDEIHAFFSSKRGVHLALSLERLAALCDSDPQRIGLSATVRPLAEAAAFLGGDRPVSVVDASEPPLLDLQVRVPVPDMQRVAAPSPPVPGGSILADLYRQGSREAPRERGIWGALYPVLLEEIRAHRSTIVFVNSRGLCERLCQRLNELAGEELVLAHHGSVSHEQRRSIEDGLKRGELSAIVATSSLELGVDMGAVDQVILVESPGSVARGLQRVGRAGHGVGEVSIGRVFPKYRGDLLECAAVARRMLRGEIEEATVPRNVLDVLAQQVVAMCCDRSRSPDELLTLARRAFPYRDLSREALVGVLEMLCGSYASTELADLHPLLSWDRESDLLSPRRGSAMLARLNAGTIPDRGNYAVQLGPDGPRIGELDEEMVFETKAGDHVLLGASSWRVESITRDRVIVVPAPGEPARLPFWRGEGPGRPVELGRAVGALTRELSKLTPDKACAWLRAELALDDFAARNLTDYVQEQLECTGEVPSDRVIVVERFRDELGDWRICLLTPFGARLHAPWALALQRLLERRSGFEIQSMYTDDGIVLRFADVDDLPEVDELFPDPDELEELVTEQLASSALFAGLFRENAARSLLMARRSARGRKPLWAQRLKAQQLLAAVQRYPAFPVVLETYRQCLAEVFDLGALRRVLRDIRSRTIRVHEAETASASPFARSLVFAYVAAYIYEQDAPLAERKAQALTLDRRLLAELLGAEELRDLIDPEVLAALEEELQQLADRPRAVDADALHDLLRRLGDLSEGELAARCAANPSAWLGELRRQRRAVEVPIAGERRWIAGEEAGLYRDGLGVVPAPGLPERFVEVVDRPLEALVRRYARTHGPFLPREPAARWGLTEGQLAPVLRLLERDGQLVHGELRPGGIHPEWCDVEVLRRLRRANLAKLRREVEAVDGATLGRFLPLWHGIGKDRGREGALRSAIAQLEGLPLPWSVLLQVILPYRVPGFRAEDLDLLAATGEIVWVGQGGLGPRDGRIALYRRERATRLIPAAGTTEAANGSSLHRAMLEHLGRRGACFLTELERAVAPADALGLGGEFELALWDLVWEGRITNDTFAPLRALLKRSFRGRGRGVAGKIAGGRWSLVEDLLDSRVSETERNLARAEMLLERYGVAARSAAHAEGLAGGFGPLYQILREMEDRGRVRRGHFVEGLQGAQFAWPGVVDRLRGERRDEPPLDGYALGDAVLLSALDPANPYGSVLTWPSSAFEGTQLRRAPGAWVVLVAGRPALYLGSGGRQLASFPEVMREPGALDVAVKALRGVCRYGPRRHLLIERIDGREARQSNLWARLVAAGLEPDYRGLAVRPDL